MPDEADAKKILTASLLGEPEETTIVVIVVIA